jgi:hypothetical protein
MPMKDRAKVHLCAKSKARHRQTADCPRQVDLCPLFCPEPTAQYATLHIGECASNQDRLHQDAILNHNDELL